MKSYQLFNFYEAIKYKVLTTLAANISAGLNSPSLATELRARRRRRSLLDPLTAFMGIYDLWGILIEKTD